MSTVDAPLIDPVEMRVLSFLTQGGQAASSFVGSMPHNRERRFRAAWARWGEQRRGSDCAWVDHMYNRMRTTCMVYHGPYA
ncbi:MAG TPA: hypothetical protein VLH75_12070 [Longimicrobiales bacterium]|nr:hypothetical protein [Longimicrobiales bacterium]